MSRTARPLPDARIGRSSALLALLALPAMATQVALVAQAPELLRAAAGGSLARVAPQAVAAGLGLLVPLVLAPVALLQQLRRAQRSAGRLRLLVTSLGATLNGAACAGLLALGLRVGPELLAPGLSLGLLTPQAAGSFSVASGLAAAGAVLTCAGALSCWPLLPETTRRRSWLLVDAALLCLVGWAVTQLPARPLNEDAGAMALPSVRLVATTVGALRLIIRLLPVALNLIEALGFRTLVASRHLRAKKSGFLAAISVLSVLAVTLSCIALTITLSVMGGFRHDLKRKILGNNAHIVIDRERGTIEGWGPLLKRAAAADGVVGASPFVSGEVMISSASNLGTAVLRGIDLRTVGKVNDLERNLRSGKLDYLAHPERLLDLPPDVVRSGIMPLPSFDDDIDGATGDKPSSPPSDAEQAELEAKLAELEQFLRDTRRQLETDAAAGNAGPVDKRDVLPGIVIGQELARSLRLYVGDEVNVVAPLGALGPSGPMPKSRPYRIAGIFYSGMYEYDMKFTYVELGQGQRFLGTGDAVSGIEVKVADTDQAPAIASAIETSLGRDSLRVQDWQRLNSRLFGALALEKLAMFITLGIAILVASFCIAGTLTLMVQEKGREVAVMKAMGASDRSIVGVFVIEGGMIGVLGAALGLFLGYVVCYAAEHFGIKLNPEVYYIERLPVHIDPTEFILTGVSAVLICLLVTIYPALQASRLRPIDALRYE